MTGFKQTALFGGAIKSSIPEDFVDVSTFRQVPDHQEVYASKIDDQSLIFEILQEVEGSDEEALEAHIEELATLNGSQFTKLESSEGSAAHLPGVRVITTAGTLVSRKWGRTEVVSEDHAKVPRVYALLSLIRLKEHNTDILITLNVPCTTTENIDKLDRFLNGEPIAPFVGAQDIHKQATSSFQIIDRSLFL